MPRRWNNIPIKLCIYKRMVGLLMCLYLVNGHESNIARKDFRMRDTRYSEISESEIMHRTLPFFNQSMTRNDRHLPRSCDGLQMFKLYYRRGCYFFGWSKVQTSSCVNFLFTIQYTIQNTKLSFLF